MEITPTRPATELASLTASALQTTRFKERRAREAESDVRNQVVYFSPVIKINPETQTAVIQFRDGETGEVKNEYPQKSADAYEAAQKTAPKSVEKDVDVTSEDVTVTQGETIDEDA